MTANSVCQFSDVTSTCTNTYNNCWYLFLYGLQKTFHIDYWFSNTTCATLHLKIMYGLICDLKYNFQSECNSKGYSHFCEYSCAIYWGMKAFFSNCKWWNTNNFIFSLITFVSNADRTHLSDNVLWSPLSACALIETLHSEQRRQISPSYLLSLNPAAGLSQVVCQLKSTARLFDWIH